MTRADPHMEGTGDSLAGGRGLVRQHESGPRRPAPASTDIAVDSLDLSVKVELYPTGWLRALQRGAPKIHVQSTDVHIARPRVFSLALRGAAVKVDSFAFPGPGTPSTLLQRPPRSETCPVVGGQTPTIRPRSGRTRLTPPRDIVKLHDRLLYLLQPPLESLLRARQLTFPFSPFAYQYDGIGFLYSRFAAILADEMGLGKTMQAITAIRLLLHAGELNRVLLICPKPLVTNWQREFAQWAPEVPVTVVEGDQTRRRWLWQRDGVPVRIANYELLIRDRDMVCQNGTSFDLVVLDEAQRIKNRNSTTSQITRAIPRRRSWALTGTPIENRAEDFVAIFDFLVPGLLHDGMTPQAMGGATRDYVIRRTKQQVLRDLPPKLYRDAELDLTPAQDETYRMAEEQGVLRLTEMDAEITIQHVFELVLRLKQICNYDPATDASSKLERLEADLEEVAASGQKAIIFSQWVGTIQWLRERLNRFGPMEYHGQVATRKRDAVIDDFRRAPDRHVLLMSYGAGSVGLNLQFCSYVFLFDRWWNPAVEDQAINRAHRIGAVGPVTVTRMLTLGTIEERIHQILEEKRALFQTVFAESGAPASLGLTRDEIFGLFNIQLRSTSDRAVA